MKKRIASSILAASTILGGSGVLSGGAQAASSGEDKKITITKKTAGLAIGGSCLATGLGTAGIAGIIGGIYSIKSFNTFVTRCVDYIYDNDRNLDNLTENIKDIEGPNDFHDAEIFDEKNRNMIRGYKELLCDLFGFRAYFIKDFLIKSVDNDSDMNDDQKVGRKNEFRKRVDQMAKICKLYEACISKYGSENLSKLYNDNDSISVDDDAGFNSQLANNLYKDDLFKNLKAECKKLYNIEHDLSDDSSNDE